MRIASLKQHFLHLPLTEFVEESDNLIIAQAFLPYNPSPIFSFAKGAPLGKTSSIFDGRVEAGTIFIVEGLIDSCLKILQGSFRSHWIPSFQRF